MLSTWLVVAWYAAASAAAFGLFAWDKRRASRGGRRVSERTLHLAELAGGWPGVILGMRLLRHKNRKPAYFAVTAAIAAVHIVCWVIALRAGM